MTTDENLGKAAIFDLDGTLLDSMGMWRDITYEYAAEKGVKGAKVREILFFRSKPLRSWAR